MKIPHHYEEEDKRPINTNSAVSEPTLTPNSAQGGRGNGGSGEMTAEKAQLFVNDHAPHTVQKASRAQIEGIEKLRDDLARMDNGGPAPAAAGGGNGNGGDEPPYNQRERDHMAYMQGQLDALQGQDRADQTISFMEIQTERDEVFQQKGFDDMHEHLMAEYMAREHPEADFHAAATAQKVELATDQLVAQGRGSTVDVKSYLQDGTELVNSYKLEGDRVIHTAPNGAEQSLTIAESRVLQADRAAAVNQNTMNAVERMKADPSVSFQQGGFSYYVRGDSLVREDANGKKGNMPLSDFKNNLAARQAQIEKVQQDAGKDLHAEQKERKDTTKATAEKQFNQVVGGDIDKMTPAQAKEALQAWNGHVAAQKPIDLNAETKKFEARQAEREEAKVVRGESQKTIVEHIRAKGEGGTVTNKVTGETYRIDGKELVRTDKGGNETLRMNADKAHDMQRAEQIARQTDDQEKKK